MRKVLLTSLLMGSTASGLVGCASSSSNPSSTPTVNSILKESAYESMTPRERYREACKYMFPRDSTSRRNCINNPGKFRVFDSKTGREYILP